MIVTLQMTDWRQWPLGAIVAVRMVHQAQTMNMRHDLLRTLSCHPMCSETGHHASVFLHHGCEVMLDEDVDWHEGVHGVWQ